MIVRYQVQDEVCYGWLQEGEIAKLQGDIYGEYARGEARTPLSRVKLLSPVQPSKIVCVGLNYVDHAKEVNLDLPKEPLLFLKPSTTVVGPGDPVIYPAQSKRLDYEAELGVVIKKKAYRIRENEAADYILGYTCANDITARDIQFADGQWTRGKSFDTFCPIGPGIVPGIDPSGLEIKLTVNGEVKQSSNTKNLIFFRPLSGSLYQSGHDAAAGRHHHHRNSCRHRAYANRRRSKRLYRGNRRVEQRYRRR